MPGPRTEDLNERVEWRPVVETEARAGSRPLIECPPITENPFLVNERDEQDFKFRYYRVQGWERNELKPESRSMRERAKDSTSQGQAPGDETLRSLISLIRMLSMNCSSSGAHQFYLERECSQESKDQLIKEWANQGRGGSPRREYPSENKERSITLARRVSEQVCFLLHWCRIPVYWPLTKRRQLRARGGESFFRERYFPAWDSWLIG